MIATASFDQHAYETGDGLRQETPHAEFGSLLRRFRERDGRSGHALARAVDVDPSYIWRIESGDREPPRANVVFAFGRALGLSLYDLNCLLLTAGYAPASLQQLGGWDEALQDVVDVLTDTRLTAAARDEFRSVLHLVAANWGQRGARREA